MPKDSARILAAIDAEVQRFQQEHGGHKPSRLCLGLLQPAALKRFAGRYSLAALGTERQPGDWTFGKNKDWGINQKWIKLGPVQLPTALLGLLPLNATGNPVLGQREAQLNAMHSDIAYHAQQAMNEDQFRQAVKELRQRKDRERQLQQNQKPKDDNTAPTLANSGQHDPVIPQP